MKGARIEGMAEGKAEGISEGKIEIARNALRKNWDVSDISDITGLTCEEIEALR
jgi:predicted transposase/invertase (TIGR01784 family)